MKYHRAGPRVTPREVAKLASRWNRLRLPGVQAANVHSSAKSALAFLKRGPIVTYGKTVKLFLADGTGTGIRFVEIVNCTLQAVAVPRSRFDEAAEHEELRRPGVYFLLEAGADRSDRQLYVGESEHVFNRLATHFAKLDWWSECIAFTSKDDNLTKGHIRYLESRLIDIAVRASRCKLANVSQPAAACLARCDRESMEEFISHIRLILNSLGLRLLHPVAVPQNETVEDESTSSALLTFKGGEFEAKGKLTDEGFVVFAESVVARDVAKSTSMNVKKKREDAAADGILVKQSDGGNSLRMTKDYLLNSPSEAAGFVSGCNRSGLKAWKSGDGTALGNLPSKSSLKRVSILEILESIEASRDDGGEEGAGT